MQNLPSSTTIKAPDFLTRSCLLAESLQSARVERSRIRLWSDRPTGSPPVASTPHRRGAIAPVEGSSNAHLSDLPECRFDNSCPKPIAPSGNLVRSPVVNGNTRVGVIASRRQVTAGQTWSFLIP